jgi:glycosyltransferase involved in cell wall biosynthesis
MQNKLISVIMPAFNAEAYISEAISSILSQTYTNFEFIIIDDGSNDRTAAIIKKYAQKDARIKVITLATNRGLAKALNYGLDAAKGTYIARMDADDISLPTRFEQQITYLKNNKNVVAVGGQAELINTKSRVIGLKSFPNDPKQLYKLMFEAMPIQHPILMAYAKYMKQSRYENKTTAEDVSMFFKLLRFGDFGNVPNVIFQYRIHTDSNSLKNLKKTFILTVRSRIKAVLKYGYKPSLHGLLITVIQFGVVLLLPRQVVLKLYEMWRLNKNTLRKDLITALALRS